jgi:GrpB-like predicted nucleotidyltransferase (UPF0157 family)
VGRKEGFVVKGSITLEPPNPAWVQRFEEEKTRLLVASPASFRGLEHFGSTVVPGLVAKPIIDILGGAGSMGAADALLDLLDALGWDTSPEFNATLPNRRFLLRWLGGVRTHHLHLVIYGSEAWHKPLRFRDCLRAPRAGRAVSGAQTRACGATPMTVKRTPRRKRLLWMRCLKPVLCKALWMVSNTCGYQDKASVISVSDHKRWFLLQLLAEIAQDTSC